MTTAAEYRVAGRQLRLADPAGRPAIRRDARAARRLPPSRRAVRAGARLRHRELSLALAERYPRARFAFLDAAPKMLLTTGSRLEERHPAVAKGAQFLEIRFEELDRVPSF